MAIRIGETSSSPSKEKSLIEKLSRQIDAQFKAMEQERSIHNEAFYNLEKQVIDLKVENKLLMEEIKKLKAKIHEENTKS